MFVELFLVDWCCFFFVVGFVFLVLCLLGKLSVGNFEFCYFVGLCMYGYIDIVEILLELFKLGVSVIDIWFKVYGF